MKLSNLSHIVIKGLTALVMMLALLAQPIIGSIDMIWDTDIELSNLNSPQEQEEEQQEKDPSEKKIELFAYDSNLPYSFDMAGATTDQSHELLWEISLEITIPPPDYI